jgi:hypothetical protein
MATGTTTKPRYIEASLYGPQPNDRIATTGELAHVADDGDFIDGITAGQVTAFMHAGQPVVCDIVGASTATNVKVRAYNGTSWVDLVFPATNMFALGTGPLVRAGSVRLASDGTTLWLSVIVDETLDGSYLDPSHIPPGTFFWTVGSTYVLAHAGGGWSVVYTRRGATLNAFTTGPLADSPGAISHQLASHPGAGYAWECSIEVGNRGGNIADPFTTCLAISAKVDAAGVLDEVFGLNYGDNSRPSLYAGVYYGPDQADDGTVISGQHVEALWTDAGFPIYVSSVFSPAGTRSAVRADTFSQLQTSAVFSKIVDWSTHNGLVYLACIAPDAYVASLFYPEEVESFPDNFSRIVLFTIPVDASSAFTSLTDRNTEDVSLVKNPLQDFGPADFSAEGSLLAAVTGPHRPWVAFNRELGDGNEYIYLFVLNDGCPFGHPKARYNWDYAQTAGAVPAFVSPARIGTDIDETLLDTVAYGTVFDVALNRIYVIGWAHDPVLADGRHYLRCWYFELCNGCLKDCGEFQGLHVHWRT